MTLILERWFAGWNNVMEAEEDVRLEPGIDKFSKFVDRGHVNLNELSGFLKVPLEKLQILYNDKTGYITGDAQRNINDYLAIRHNPAERAYYESCQHGWPENESDLHLEQ